jgi:hypothetical protein
MLRQDREGAWVIVGDFGNHSTITGEVRHSTVMAGMISVETEHGTLMVDADLVLGAQLIETFNLGGGNDPRYTHNAVTGR